MSKDIVLSIRPEWTALIKSGQKRLELRKSKPKQPCPFKVYIYEAKGDFKNHGCGKVIGEFICDWIKKDIYPSRGLVDVIDQRMSCIPPNQIMEYAKHGIGSVPLVYWWHISELKIYETPFDISDLGFKRPPQSWAFLKGDEPENE